MRDNPRSSQGTVAGTRPAWFALGSLLVVVEVVALVTLMVSAPSPGTRIVASWVALPSGAFDGTPPVMDRRALPTTTTPPPLPPAPAPTTVAPPPRPAAAPVAHNAPPPPTPRAVPVSATHGILPPGHPPASIAPAPNFLAACSAAGYDNSPQCTTATLAAIDNGRRAEALPPMTLPSNWAGLGPQEQLFVATDLERLVRGLPPLSLMATALDAAASAGAASGNDPSPPPGFPFQQWGANWAGGVGGPLEAVYYWMYDDGPGSSNADCTPGNRAGCWGHRDKMLMSLSCSPCVMGAGFAPHGWGGQPSWAELLVGTSGSPAADFTWQQETPYL